MMSPLQQKGGQFYLALIGHLLADKKYSVTTVTQWNDVWQTDTESYTLNQAMKACNHWMIWIDSSCRQGGKSVMMKFFAELWILSEFCDFGDMLYDFIKDHLVSGINGDKIQQILLSEPKLMLAKAAQVDQVAELAKQGAAEIHKGPHKSPHTSFRDQWWYIVIQYTSSPVPGRVVIENAIDAKDLILLLSAHLKMPTAKDGPYVTCFVKAHHLCTLWQRSVSIVNG